MQGEVDSWLFYSSISSLWNPQLISESNNFLLNYVLSALSVGLRRPLPITHPQGSLRHDTKLDLEARPRFWSSGKGGITTSLLSLPGPLWPGMLAFVRFLSMDQINLFEIISNRWNHTTVVYWPNNKCI